MKLIPFLRFGGGGATKEEDGDSLELPPNELLNPPEDEQTEPAENEETQEEEKTEDDKPQSSDDEMLKMFISVDEEFADNSGLASQMDDVSTEDLVQELRVLASAFGIRVPVTEEEAV